VATVAKLADSAQVGAVVSGVAGVDTAATFDGAEAPATFDAMTRK
jgi:hypothetical protein